MKKLIIVFCLFSAHVFSEETFEKTYSLFTNPQMYFVQELHNGGYIICGKSMNLSDSTTDFSFLKTDFAGNALWSKQIIDTSFLYGYPTHEWATTIREKTDGSFIFGGSVKDPFYSSSVAFYGWMDSSGTMITSTFKGSSWTTSVNALLLNANGTIVSTRDEREGAGHYANFLEVNSLTGQYISGDWAGNFSIANQALIQMQDSGYATISIEENTDQNLMYLPIVSRFNSAGNIVWKKFLQNEVYSSDTQFVALCPATNSGIMICGYVKNGNILLTKINANGDSLWTKAIEGFGIPSSIQQTSDGGYAVLGTLNNSMLLLKTDENANIIWMQSYTNAMGDTKAVYFQQTADEGFILLGNSVNGKTYLVKTDSTGNSNTITKTGKVDPAKVFSLYPDPFPSSINVNFPGNRLCIFSLCDVTGRIVFRKEIIGETGTFDLSFIAPGIYCAFIPVDGYVLSKIILKQ